MRLRYGCSTPTAVSVGSPQLQTAHAQAGDGSARMSAAASPNASRTAVVSSALVFGGVAIAVRSVVGVQLADVAFAGAAARIRVAASHVRSVDGAALVALPERDRARAGAD